MAGKFALPVHRGAQPAHARDVVLHTGPEADALARGAGALAVTWGRHIALGADWSPGTPLGNTILDHELAHARQQAEWGPLSDVVDPRTLPLADGGAEGEAHDAGLHGTGTRPRGLALARCPNSSNANAIDAALRGTGPGTRALAEEAVQLYSGMSTTDRQTFVTRYLPYARIGPLLDLLPPRSTEPGGAYEVPVRDLLQRIQRVGAQTYAATTGLATEADMVNAQGAHMTAEATAAAAAAAPTSVTPPTPAQITAAHTTQVTANAIAPPVATMTPAAAAVINTTLTTVTIPAFLTWCRSAHPELPLAASNFRADALAVFNRGANVLGFGGGPASGSTGSVCVVGQAWSDTVAVNPAYGLPIVVHEVYGHSTYGVYGAPGVEYGLELYDRAAPLMPGYTQPAPGVDANANGVADRTEEIDNFAYQETEMYSWMRMVPYYVPTAATDTTVTANYDPGPQIIHRISRVKAAWEPRVARSLLRGLYLRFMADPTIRGPAMNYFRDGVRAAFPTDAPDILR